MQVQKTEHFDFAPIYTPDGVDYLYTELDFAVTAILNPQALATKGPLGIATGAGGAFLEDAPAQGSGDSLGNTLRQIRPLLLAPRGNLVFTINGDTVLNVTGPDAKNGPLVQPDTYIRAIIGTRTAFVYFHVKCWVQEFVPTGSNARRVVLANRYRLTSVTDENWYTTRHVVGQMIVDVGALLASRLNQGEAPLTPDSFRQAAFLQIPLGFKRRDVQVTVASDNSALDYSYVDEETPLALGAMSLATKVEGYATVGANTGLEQLGIISKAVAGAVGPSAPREEHGWFYKHWPWHPIDNISAFQRAGAYRDDPILNTLASAISNPAALLSGPPKLQANAILRITGQRNANRAQLMMLGINLIYSIFNTGEVGNFILADGVPRFASLFVTQDIVERFVEVRATLVSTAYQDLSLIHI